MSKTLQEALQKTVTFKYDIGRRVTTPLGDTGFVEVLGYQKGGISYHVRTSYCGAWFFEDDLEDPLEHFED